MRGLFAAIAFAGAFAISAAATAQAEGDAAKGEKVFRKCKICHQVGDGAKNMVGPHLNNIVGTQPGTHAEGYEYSPAMVEWGKGKVWDDATLASFLENPKGVVDGTKMAFVGLKKESERADVIAYLKQFSK